MSAASDVTMSKLLDTLGCTFNYSTTNRIGKLPEMAKGGRKYPRNIKLRLLTKQQKSEMFGLKKDLNQIQGYEKVTFWNDLDNKELMAHREVKQIHTAAVAMEGVSSRRRGDSIVIDQRLYRKSDFGNLPHGLTLENVSTLTTPDGTAFQGHNSPLSNMYHCKLRDSEGREAHCVEQLYAIRMAEICKADLVVHNQIKAEKNPYTILTLTKGIKQSDEWRRRKVDILREIVDLKFVTHPNLMEKLQGYSKPLFYEATQHPLFGCGYTLQHANALTADKVSDDRNLMGIIVRDIRERYAHGRLATLLPQLVCNLLSTAQQWRRYNSKCSLLVTRD